MLAKSLLWEISNETSQKSYIFGTMHVKDDAAYRHLAKALNHLILCQDFYCEIDLKAAQTEISFSEYLLPNKLTLLDYLKPNQYIKAKAIILKAFSIDIDPIKNLKPLIIVNKIAEVLMSDDHSRPLDYFLWTKADELRLNRFGLETIEEQVSTLRSLEIDKQIKMFKDMYKNVHKFRAMTNQLKQYYINQDISQLYKSGKESLGSFRKTLLYDRNETMAHRIFENKTVASFYAIGAAHLAGQKGILSLLNKKGLKTKAIF